LELVDEDGEEYSAESSDDLFYLLAECDDFENPCDTIIIGGGYLACYEISFPVDVVLVDGDVVTVADEDEFFNLMFSGEIAGFSYPMDLIDPDGNVITVNSDEELDEAIFDCGFNVGGDQFILLAGTGDDNFPACYEINFPLDFMMLDGSTLTINSMDEYEANMEAAMSIVYPVSVTLVDNGSVVELEGIEDLFELLTDCEG
jgi:hypothetical protein